MTKIEGPFLDWLNSAEIAAPGRVALLQGYPLTSFAVLRGDEWRLPPGMPAVKSLKWDLFWDIRVFGDGVEYHAWRTSQGWFWRKLDAGKLPAESPYEKSYYLWGNKLDGEVVDGWWCCSEDRGARVWIPVESKADPKGPLPLQLKMRCVIEKDPTSGLAGIVDAAIVGFEQD